MAQDTSTNSTDPTISSLNDQLIAGDIPSNSLSTEGGVLTLSTAISIKSLDKFLNTAMSAFGVGNVIPSSLPVNGITLNTLEFTPKSDTSSYSLTFSLSWDSAKWEIFPGLLSLESPEIDVEVIGGRVFGQVSAVAEVEGIPVYLSLELPGELFRMQLVTGEADSSADGGSGEQRLTSLMSKFQAGKSSSGSTLPKGITLKDLSLIGSVQDTHALFNVSLGNMTIGEGDMSLQLAMDYFGGAQSSITGSVWGEYSINEQISISLLAEFDGPGQGWLFKGGVQTDPATRPPISELIKAFDTDASKIPDFLSRLEIDYLDLSYNTGAKSFSFSCEVDAQGIFGSNTEVGMTVNVNLTKQTDGYEITFGGQLVFKLNDGYQLEFDIVFNKDSTGDTLIAVYKNLSGGTITIGDLTKKINPALDVPLSIELKDAFLIYDKSKAEKTTGSDEGDQPATPASSPANILFGLDIGSGIDLSNLPLIGKLLPADQTMKIGIQPLVAFGKQTTKEGETVGTYFSADELAKISGLLPNGTVNLPTTDIIEKLGVGVNLDLGGEVISFDLPIEMNNPPNSTNQNQDISLQIGNKSVPASGEPSGDEGTSSLPATSSPGAIATSSSGGATIQWINVQKNFGPVQFNRIGLQYAEQKIWAFLDAGINLAGLTLTLDGLGVGSPIQEIKPEFKLLGVGVDYAQGPIEIGGSFLKNTFKTEKGEEYTEFDGLATIKTEVINISAIGSYAKVNGHDSLFIYAVLNEPIGGAPYFFITGLAAGFGYNRAVRLPDISQVGQFPLVNQAVSGEGSPIPADAKGRSSFLQNEISQLGSYIYPKPGQFFLTAGIRFTTFEIIDSFLMAIVSFGQHFEVDILGLSTLIAPTPEEGQSVSPLAEVQLALKASFIPDEGVLSVQGQLTSNSFLISRDCHLTGGFAFYSWFNGPHKDDFVVSIGGYHPKFIKPSHYPSVPRLGLSWRLSSTISIKGDLYFAMCSHALMAGGSLQAVFKKGGIKAWFTIGADFIVSWKPYFYEATMSAGFGVSYTFRFFGRHTVTAHLGADLHVWGPDFSGKAKIHLYIVSFTISFGNASNKPLPIDWGQFSSSFLPAADKICSHNVTGGLVKTIEEDSGDNSKKPSEASTTYVVNQKQLKLTISSVVPLTKVTMASDSVEPLKVFDRQPLTSCQWQSKTKISSFVPSGNVFTQESISNGTSIKYKDFGIAPMDLKSGSVESTLLLTIKKDDKVQVADFTLIPILKNLPAALWGNDFMPGVNPEAPFVENMICGVELVPAKPPAPGTTHAVNKKDLLYTTTELENAFGFETMEGFNTSSEIKKENIRITIENSLRDRATTSTRRAALSEMGFDLHDLGLNISDSLVSDFVREPQIGEFSSLDTIPVS